MKIYRKLILFVLICTTACICSCEKYLEKTPKADLSEEKIFNNFTNFQGFVETMYDDVVDWVHLQASYSEFNWGDDIIPSKKRGFIEGDYFFVIDNGNSPYYNNAATRASGLWSDVLVRNHAIWQNSWFGIRAANVSLAHLNDLTNATDEERRLIEGQAYFFRGYFHWEMMRAWGNIPYADRVYTPNEEMKIPQLGYYETAEKIMKDLQRAADLLPTDWDNTTIGGATLGGNIGRATKGMALAFMSECALYCASPLMNGVAKGSYTYHTDYAKRAADYAWKVIELANQGVYQLEPWTTYSDIFFKKNGTLPRSKETIFTPPQRGNARFFTSSFTGPIIGTDNWFSAPTQNYVELFETKTGLPIDDPESQYVANDPWNNRDPRFRYNIRVDRDRQVVSRNDDLAFVQFYVGGRERTTTTSLTGFGYRKYWDETINKYDNGWATYYYRIPRLRLAEIYLFYAEAANEAYGPTGMSPGANLTAIDALNIVRSRANMPGVNAKFTGSTASLRDRIWNERAVELAYESKRWYDLRRWHVAHLLKHRELYGLEFDKNHTYYKKTLVSTVEFSERHYWLPFPTSQVSLYSEWKQNPGW